ncbi:MAG: hypothetical protein WA177_10405, partial [Xanthobacteraceae bacterium]
PQATLTGPLRSVCREPDSGLPGDNNPVCGRVRAIIVVLYFGNLTSGKPLSRKDVIAMGHWRAFYFAPAPLKKYSAGEN